MTPVGIDPQHAPAYLLAATRESWNDALSMGEKYGYRNAQTTLLAPTGTIGLLMDCATTGVEPDFALVKFKKLVVLIDEMTQSSAEVMAASLKRYNVGTLVGTNTKGWGTIENTFKLESQMGKEQQLSLFLVHSLTVGDNEQLIEGVGVAPIIDVSDSSWKDELYNVFSSREIVTAVESLL